MEPAPDHKLLYIKTHGARLAVKVAVSLSFPQDLHPLHPHQFAWRTTILPPSGVDPVTERTVSSGGILRA